MNQMLMYSRGRIIEQAPNTRTTSDQSVVLPSISAAYLGATSSGALAANPNAWNFSSPLSYPCRTKTGLHLAVLVPASAPGWRGRMATTLLASLLFVCSSRKTPVVRHVSCRKCSLTEPILPSRSCPRGPYYYSPWYQTWTAVIERLQTPA